DRRALCTSPRDRELCRGDTATRGQLRQRGSELLIPGQVVAGKSRQVGTEVPSPSGGLRAGEQAARQHAVGSDRDAELVECGEDLSIGPADNGGVLDMQIEDR